MISGTRNRLSAEVARQTQLQRDIEKLQIQVSTQKRLQTPSDDPVASVRVSQVRRSQGNEAAYAANAETATTLATRVDTAFSSINTALDRARELTVLSANDTYSPEQRQAFAVELRDIAKGIAATAVQKDPRGIDLFPTGVPTVFPIGDGLTASGTLPRSVVFGGVATGGTAKDIATILEEAAVAAESGDAADRTAALQAVGDASDHIIQAHSLHGLEASRIDQAKESLAQSGVLLADERSGIEATDIPEAVTLIKAKLTTLDAAQAIFARVNQKTLFDVLR